MRKTSYVLIGATLLLAGAALAYLFTGSYIPPLDIGLVYLALCGLIVGVCVLAANYVRASDVRESPLSSDYRRHSGPSAVTKKDKDWAGASQQRHLSRISRLTRALIEVANREQWSPGGMIEGGRGAPEAVANAQNQLLETMHCATLAGLPPDIVRSGLEQGVNDSVAISELAYRMIGDVRMRYMETEI